MQHALIAPGIGAAIVRSTHLPMQGKTLGRLALVIFILAIVAVVHFWPDTSASKSAAPSAPVDASRDTITPKRAGETGPGVPSATLARGATADGMAPAMPTVPPGAAVRIDVDAPTTVRTGDSFEATVNLEAYGGIRQLAFQVNFDKRVLQFVDASKGLFVQQGGAPAQFDAEDPSDGFVLVNLDVNNGYAIAGTGSVVILQFQALKAGVTPIALTNITFVDNVMAGASTTTSAHDALVTVE
jgi:general secretion pathway protein D